MIKSLALILFVVGCKSDDDKMIVTPDAMVDADTPAMNTITVEIFGDTPIFIMYRDGARAWQTPAPVAGGYELKVHDAYELVAVCDGDGYYETGVEASTYDEVNGATYVPCYGTGGEPPTPVTYAVTGTMVQPGTAMMGFQLAEGTTSNWSFSLDAEAGMHDLVAVADTKMALRRNINVTAPMSLGSIDATTSLQSVLFTLTGAEPDETFRSFVWFITTNDFTMLPERDGRTALVVPAAQLVASDRQYLWMSADGNNTSRSVFTRYTTGTTPTYPLLPRLQGIQFTNTGASWSTPLPEGDVELDLSGDSSWVTMNASQGWLGSRTELAIDTDIPGFQAAWLPASSNYKSLSVSKHDTDMSQRTSFRSF